MRSIQILATAMVSASAWALPLSDARYLARLDQALSDTSMNEFNHAPDQRMAQTFDMANVQTLGNAEKFSSITRGMLEALDALDATAKEHGRRMETDTQGTLRTTVKENSQRAQDDAMDARRFEVEVSAQNERVNARHAARSNAVNINDAADNGDASWTQGVDGQQMNADSIRMVDDAAREQMKG